MSYGLAEKAETFYFCWLIAGTWVRQIAVLSMEMKHASSADTNCSVFKGSSKDYVFGFTWGISHI